MREWQIKRRERTRQLIELGGLVVKAGLVELADDDRATLYGAFLTVAAKLRGEEREQALVLWKRKGKRAFDAEAKGANNAANLAFGSNQRPAINGIFELPE
ncbi:MAG: conjugal transfer protein TraD [Novosphingobium sp.]